MMSSFNIFYLFFFLNCSLSSSILPPSLVSIHMAILWILYLIKCLSQFCLVTFLKFCLSILFLRYSFASSFCLILCVCFYVLGISAMSPGLEKVDLQSRCPVGPSGTIPPGHLSQVLCGYLLCGPSCCCWAMTSAGPLWGGLFPGVTGCEAQL